MEVNIFSNWEITQQAVFAIKVKRRKERREEDKGEEENYQEIEITSLAVKESFGRPEAFKKCKELITERLGDKSPSYNSISGQET